MQVVITITNPNPAILQSLGIAMNQPAGQTVTLPSEIVSSNRIDSNNLDQLAVDDAVRWAGAKYTFDGIVESIDPDAEKTVYLRRNDTGKKVSLTLDDLDNYTLTKQ